MSKRFGRRQKRKMREQIAILLSTVETEAKAAKALRYHLNERNTVLRDVASVLGNYFCGLPPKNFEIKEMPEWLYLRFQESQNMGHGFSTSSIMDMQIVSSAITYIDLIAPQHIVDDLTQSIHIRAMTRFGDASYGLSKKAVLTMPRDKIIRHISQEMAEYLTQNIFKKG